MRYPKEHKEQVRGKLLADSARHAKQHGFASSGVDALAASAGLTIGSLYKHFASKNELFAALIGTELHRTATLFAALDPDDEPAVQRALGGYLSMGHVRAADQGCALPALAAEVARADEGVHEAFEAGLVELQGALARLAGSDGDAWVLLAQSVGAVMLARAMASEGRQRELLSAVRRDGGARLQAGRSASAHSQASTRSSQGGKLE